MPADFFIEVIKNGYTSMSPAYSEHLYNRDKVWGEDLENQFFTKFLKKIPENRWYGLHKD